MPHTPRTGLPRQPGAALYTPGSRFQRYRWVVLAAAVVLVVIVVAAVHWADSTLHPLDPVGAGVVFISVAAAGLGGMLIGFCVVLVAIVAAFLLHADFSTAAAAANAAGSAVIWVVATVLAGLTVNYFRRQVVRREAALEQALGRSLSVRDKMERVLDFSPQFHRGDSLAEVLQAICDTAFETFGSNRAHLYAVNGTVLELLALSPAADSLPLGLGFHLDDYPDLEGVLRSRRPSYVRDARTLLLKGGALRLQHEHRVISTTRIPILSPEGVIGLLSLSWDHVIERPTDELLAIMRRFGDQAAIVWQNALRAEVQRQADDLRRTLDKVLDLAPTFHITGPREKVAQAICEAAIATFGSTAAAVYRVEGDRLRVLARVPPISSLAPGLTFPLTGKMPLARQLRAGTPTFVPDVTDPARSVQPWPPEVIRGSGTRSALYVPIRFGEHGPRNLFVLGWDRPHEWPDRNLMVVVQRFADQAALALMNASAERLHARLEANLLPSLPVDHPRLSVTTRYRTGEQRLHLGGDFIGSTLSPSGAFHFVIGDVSGHGPDAAALGATLGSTWRALTLAGEGIPETIAVMRQVLLAERAESSAFATIIAGCIDLEAGSLCLANIAHPPPLLIAESVLPLEAPVTPPLGFGEATNGAVRCFTLPPQWALLCYTDGLTDARVAPGSSERYGEERLKERLGAWTTQLPDADKLDELLSGIETLGDEPFPDDVAVLLISTKDAVGDP